jgi:hypothetical protein
MISFPITYLVLDFNNSIVSAIPIAANVGVPKIAGATVAALIVIDKSLNYLMSKYRWVNFLDELKQLKKY